MVKDKSCITRRGLVASAVAAGAAGIAVSTSAGVARAAEAATSDFVDAVTWDAEYDVIVVGYGFAGGYAAITAADNGARVLLVEKAPKGLEGGSSRYAGQGFTVPRDDPQQLVEYFQSIRGYYDKPSDAMIQAYVDKAATAETMLQSELGFNPDDGHTMVSAGEYKELPGGTGDDKDNGPCKYIYVSKGAFDASHYNLVQDNVADRADMIDVWYECPATHLVQDPQTKVVHGVTVEHEGAEYHVRAINGVVLTTGGYENSKELLSDHVLMPVSIPFGAAFNTGDGVRMAQEVGANLWHMANIAGPIWGLKTPDNEHGYTNLGKPTGVIYVGPDGTRFVNEAVKNRHGHISYGGHYEQQPAVVPAYALMDADWLAKNRLVPQFSEGNVEEIEKGYFISADTIEELAEKIYDDMPDFARLPNYTKDMGPYVDRLKTTVNGWNAAVEAGVDERFGRDPKTFAPLSTPPFYAIKLDLMMFNTQGGAERNEKAQVIGLDGEPIPHLYSAGEFGAMWPDIYNGGCNIGECVMYGRIAGEQVAQVPDDAVTGTHVSGTPVSFPAAPDEEPVLGTNEYEGVATGIGGRLVVVCTIEDKAIKDVKVARAMETPGFGTKALAALPERIVEANGINIDTYSGATSTSNALFKAVASCMEQAGMEVVRSTPDGSQEFEVSGAPKFK